MQNFVVKLKKIILAHLLFKKIPSDEFIHKSMMSLYKSLWRHEHECCLMRIRFKRNFSHHRASLIILHAGLTLCKKSEKIYASIAHKTWKNPWTHFGLPLAQKPQNKVFLDKSFGSVLITDVAATSCKNQNASCIEYWQHQKNLILSPFRPTFGPKLSKQIFSKNILRQL